MIEHHDPLVTEQDIASTLDAVGELHREVRLIDAGRQAQRHIVLRTSLSRIKGRAVWDAAIAALERRLAAVAGRPVDVHALIRLANTAERALVRREREQAEATAAETAAGLIAGADAPEQALAVALRLLADHPALQRHAHGAVQAALLLLTRSGLPSPAPVAAGQRSHPGTPSGPAHSPFHPRQED